MADVKISKQLAASLAKPTKSYAEILGGEKKKKPGIISRAFDVLSRPLYGIAETTARAAEHKGIGDIAEGLVGGLAGKNKTTFADTLLRSAEANPKSLLAKPIKENKFNSRIIAGLVGDIGLDPTTYVGGALTKPTNILKDIAKGEREVVKTAKAVGQAAEAAKIAEHAVTPAGQRIAHLSAVIEEGERKADAIKRGVVGAAKKERKAFIEEVNTKTRSKYGRPMTSKEWDKRIPAFNKSVLRDTKKIVRTSKKELNGLMANLDIEAKAARDAAEIAHVTENAGEAVIQAPGKVAFKFAGKKVGESEKIYKGISSVGRAANKIPGADLVAKAFRPAKQYADNIYSYERARTLEGASRIKEFNHKLNATIDAFKLGDKELTDILHATERGIDLEGDAGKIQTWYRDGMRDLEKEAVDARLMDPAESLGDRFVPHYYQSEDKTLKGKFRNGRNPLKPGEFKTLEEAEKAGLKPVTDFREVMHRKVAELEQAKINKSVTNMIVGEYGIEGSHALGEAMSAKGFDHVPHNVNRNLPREGMYFPKPVADTLKYISVLQDKARKAPEITSLEKIFSKVTGIAKRYQIGYNPGAFARNAAGDLLRAHQIGATSPNLYENAARMLFHEVKNAPLEPLGSGADFLRGTVTSKGGVRVGSKVWKDNDIFHAWQITGGRFGQIAQEIETKGNKFGRKIAAAGEKREDLIRLAVWQHYMKELGGHLTKDSPFQALVDVGEKASELVRKNLIDYGAKTEIERKYLSKGIPYYTFMSRNIPLQIESLFMTPGKIATLSKGERALQSIMGGKDTQELAPWLQEFSAVRVDGEGEGHNAIYWLNPNPFKEAAALFEGTGTEVLGNFTSQITPLLLSPLELSSGHKTFNKKPIGPVAPYLAGLLPQSRLLVNTLSEGYGDNPDMKKKLQLLNFLTGARLQENPGT